MLMMHHLIIIGNFLIIINCQLSLSITASSYINSQTSNHKLTIYKSDIDVIPSGSYITVQYNPLFTLTSLAYRNITTDFCQTGCNISTVTANATGSIVTINSMFPSLLTKRFTIFFTLKNIVNPQSVGVYSVTISLFDSGNNLILTAMTNIQIYSSPMTCTGAPITTAVSQLSVYTFTVTPINSLPSNGYMLLVFPTQWSTSNVPITISSVSCVSLVGGSGSCTTISSTQYRFNGLLPSTTSTTFSFQMGNILNPASQQPNNQIIFKYYSNTSVQLSSCNAKIGGYVASNLTLVDFNIINVANGVGVGKISFTTVEQAFTTDELRIQFDGSFNVLPLAKSFTFVSNLTSPSSPQVTVTNNLVSLLPFQSSIPTNYSVLLNNIGLPISFKPAANISIGIFRNNFLVSTISCCNYTLNTSNVDNLTAVIQLSDSQIGRVSDYTFNVSMTVTPFAYLLVVFPSLYGLSSGACTIVMNYQIQSPSCNIINSTTINITSLLVYNYISFSFSIRSILNPPLNSPSIQLRTINSNGYLMRNINVQLSLTTTKISYITVLPSNTMVGSVATYTFTINNTNVLVTGSKIHILSPTQITFLATITCTINAVLNNCSRVNNSYVVLDLTAAYSAGALLLDNIAIVGVNNPQSVAPSDSFIVQLQSQSNIIEQSNFGIIVSMNILPTFTTLSITPSNTLTATTATYIIAYALPFTMISSNATMVVQLTSNYIVNACSSCTNIVQIPINSSIGSVTIDNVTNPSIVTISDSIICTVKIDGYNSVQSQVILSSWSPSNAIFTIASNHTFLGESVRVVISLTNLSIYTSIIIINIPSQYTINNITTTTYANIGNPAINVVGYQINISGITLKTSNITVQISGISNPQASPSSSWSLSTYNGGNILISQSTSNISFVSACTFPCRQCNGTQCLSCYNSPPLNTSKYLSSGSCIPSCNSTSYLINFNCYACNPLCLTCSSMSYNCTTCNSSMLLFSNKCIISCPDGYSNVSGICQVCSSPCFTCNTSGCTSCQAGSVLSGLTCIGGCPLGQYNSSNICIGCDSNCSACDSTGCTLCTNSTYLFQKQCLVACPNSYYLSSNSTICQACLSPCATCSIRSTNCTSCLAVLPFYLSNQCLPACPNTTYADQNMNCIACIYPCLNCNSATNCTSCQPTLLLYSATQQCLSACPSNTILIGNTCQRCQSPCLVCSLSIINCTLCVELYFLLNNTCTLNCTSPYFPVNGYCSKCYSPCLTCVNAQPYKCITCIPSHYILSQSCYSACPKGTFISGLQCSLCDSGCYQCQNSSATCLSCIPGLYLYVSSCVSSCPTINATIYYPYQAQCITCQPQCTTCLSSPIECNSCANLSYKFNVVTRECTTNCSSPFFADNLTCRPCQLPCKSCLNTYNQCSACYNTKYLYNQQCIDACPTYHYNSTNNTCIPCQPLCASCDSNQCFQCTANNYFYQGTCYSVCPPQSPYAYKSYCRNCLKDNCLMCANGSICTMCQPPYYGFDGSCVLTCPNNYQLDNYTSTKCVLTEDVALSRFMVFKQKLKAYPFLGITIFIVMLPLLCTTKTIPLMAINALVAIPQAVSTIFFLFFIYYYSQLVGGYAIIVGVVYMLMGVLHCLFAWRILRNDGEFKQWLEYGSNQHRTYIVMVASCLNKRLIYLLFSGLNWFPFTCYRLASLSSLKPLSIITIINILLVELPLIAVFLLIMLYQHPYNHNNKLFFSGLDITIINTIGIVVSVWEMLTRNTFPDRYNKYILEGVSKKCHCNYSQTEQIEEQQNDNGLHRSYSQQNIQTTKQIDSIQFNSQFDPNDYQQADRVDLQDINSALKKGHFRKKKKKKKNFFHQQLDVIDEESSEEQELKGKKKKIKKNKIGYVNNYIYWKPPEKKKRQPQKIFQMKEKEIMEKIKEKQSEFDTITQNDFIFQQELSYNNNGDSSDSDYQEDGSRRQLKMANKQQEYDNIFNLNYAARKHLR